MFVSASIGGSRLGQALHEILACCSLVVRPDSPCNTIKLPKAPVIHDLESSALQSFFSLCLF